MFLFMPDYEDFSPFKVEEHGKLLGGSQSSLIMVSCKNRFYIPKN